jgi:preprotein translocase subunit SecG
VGRIILTAEIIIAILLVITVLLQQQGTGTGLTFGTGESNFYRSRRGIEKFLYLITIILAVLFALGALLSIIF